MNLTKALLTLGIATGLLTTGWADPVNVSGESGIALNGYDPVSFHAESKPLHGDPGITAMHGGATYHFASKESQEKFQADPEKYAPQFGGFCAYGVSVGALFPVDINTALVRDGKLYLNLNPAIAKLFNEDLDGHIAKAEKNWPLAGK